MRRRGWTRSGRNSQCRAYVQSDGGESRDAVRNAGARDDSQPPVPGPGRADEEHTAVGLVQHRQHVAIAIATVDVV